MANNTDVFKNKVIELLSYSKMKLDERKNGILGSGTIEQIENILIPELELLLTYADKGEIYNMNKQKKLSIIWYVLDSWDFYDEFTKKVIYFQNYYIDLQ